MREEFNFRFNALEEKYDARFDALEEKYDTRFDVIEKKIDKNSNNIIKLQKIVIDLRDDIDTVYDLERDTRIHLKLK